MDVYPEVISSWVKVEGDYFPKEVKTYSRSSSRSIEEWNIGRAVSEAVITDEGVIWFSDNEQYYDANNPPNWLGRLDPESGSVKIFVLPYGNRVSDIEIGFDGGIWLVERSTSSLIKFDPITERFNYYSIPSEIGGWPFDLVFTPEGKGWVTVTVGSAVAEFDHERGSFLRYFRVPSVSWTAGLLYDSYGRIWVTSTLPCRGPFIYNPQTGYLQDISISWFCPDKELVERGGGLIAPGRLFKPQSFIEVFSDGNYVEHFMGIEVGRWIDYSSVLDSMVGGFEDYFYTYSLSEDSLKVKVDIPGAGIVAVKLSPDGGNAILSERLKGAIGRVPMLDFDKCFIPITESEDRAQEIAVNSCLMDNLDVFHYSLFRVATDISRPLREKVFAISYLFERPELLSAKEREWLKGSEGVEVLKEGIYGEGVPFVAEKAIFALVRNEGSEEGAKLIRALLADETHPENVEVLKRHATGLYSGEWIGKILFEEAFVSPASPYSQQNAISIFPWIAIEGIPFDRFIFYLTSEEIEDELKENILFTLKHILYFHRRDEISTEWREVLKEVLLGLVLTPRFKGIAVKCLGILGEYEDYLLEELRYGEDLPELLFALGEGGRLETAWKLLEIAYDESIDSSRRVKAGRAAFEIGFREMEVEVLRKVLELFPYVRERVLDRMETRVNRLEALLFARSITSPSGFTSLVEEIYQQGDEDLYPEMLNLSVYWADCNVVQIVEMLGERYKRELEELNKYVETITSFALEKFGKTYKKLDEIIIKIEGGVKNKKGKKEEGLLFKIEEGLAQIPEGDQGLINKIKGVKEETYNLLSYAEGLTSTLISPENVEDMKEKVESIISHLSLILEECEEKGYEGASEKIDEALEKAYEIVEKLDEMTEEFRELLEKADEVVKEGGYENLFEIIKRKEYVEGIYYAVLDNLRAIGERCKGSEDTQIPTPSEGSPYTTVDGYVYNERGKRIAGITLQIITSYTKICVSSWLCFNVPSGLSSPMTADSYGYFKPTQIPSPLVAHLFIDPAISLNYGYMKFLFGPFVLYGQSIKGEKMRIKIYLPFGLTPDYDGDELSDVAEEWYFGRDYIPVYYFHKDEKWYPADPGRYYVQRSYGLYDKDLKVKKLSPTWEDFYKMGKQQWKDHKVYTATTLKTTLEGVPFYHVLPFPTDRRWAAGGMYPWIQRRYKIQYYLFHDYSKGSNRVEICSLWGLACIGKEGDIGRHYADWEWVCLFVSTGGFLLKDIVTDVSFHRHGEYELSKPEYFLQSSKRIKVYVAKNSHGSYKSAGKHHIDITASRLGTAVLTAMVNLGLLKINPAIGSIAILTGTFVKVYGIDYTSADREVRFGKGINIDAYTTDRYARVIYLYSGRWGASGDSPGGPVRGPDGRDYFSYSR